MKSDLVSENRLLDAFVQAALDRLAKDQRVRRTLPGGGRLHFDRRLPFLCLYRRKADGTDPFGEQLVTAEPALVVAPSAARSHERLRAVVMPIAERLGQQFGGFLIVEVWSAAATTGDAAVGSRTRRPAGPNAVPRFRVIYHKPHPPGRTVETLIKSLGKIRIGGVAAEVGVEPRTQVHPPGASPLLRAAEAAQIGCTLIGIEVRSIYHDPATGDVFPAVLRALRRGISRALKQTYFTFAHSRTHIRPEHYYDFGRRSVAKAVWEVDRRLADVDRSFDLLLQATPVNAEAAWRDFRRGQFQQPPTFHYRPLTVEPALLKRQLYAIPLERVEDPTLAYLFRQKQDELDRRITMLSDIGTPRFLPESLQIYGRVSPELLALARELLDRVPTRTGEEAARGQLTAAAFARRAQEEIDYYRRQYPQFDATVSVREDMYAGLLVSQGRLLVGGLTRIPARRVEALLQHEIGTHLVTYYNGRAQPLGQLEVGLAGYDGLQEGLAVLAEWLVGGLSRHRMRLLAARVVAAQAVIDGAEFNETFRLLDRMHEFSQRTAYTITMRVYRGGGLTKDIVYLQGLVQILEYLKSGGDIEPLLVGKIAADHIPLIGELRSRKVLRPPPMRPRYLENPVVLSKLEALREGVSVLQLAGVRQA